MKTLPIADCRLPIASHHHRLANETEGTQQLSQSNRQLAIGNRQLEIGNESKETQMTRWLLLVVTILLVSIPIMAQDGNADREAVRQAVLDYVEGIYNVEPARIERSVSPNLAKMGFYRPPTETAYRPGRSMAFQQLVEISKNFNKDGKLRKDAPKDIVIYDVLDQTATVKLTADWGTDYMHLAKIDGKWMIVNVLWQSHPPKK